MNVKNKVEEEKFWVITLKKELWINKVRKIAPMLGLGFSERQTCYTFFNAFIIGFITKIVWFYLEGKNEL